MPISKRQHARVERVRYWAKKGLKPPRKKWPTGRKVPPRLPLALLDPETRQKEVHHARRQLIGLTHAAQDKELELRIDNLAEIVQVYGERIIENSYRITQLEAEMAALNANYELEER